METKKTSILPVNQDLSSVYFSLAKLFVSCKLSLAMFRQMTYTHKLPKLSHLKAETHAHRILMKVD